MITECTNVFHFVTIPLIRATCGWAVFCSEVTTAFIEVERNFQIYVPIETLESKNVCVCNFVRTFKEFSKFDAAAVFCKKIRIACCETVKALCVICALSEGSIYLSSVSPFIMFPTTNAMKPLVDHFTLRLPLQPLN